MWTKHALDLINVNLAYSFPATPGPQKIVIDGLDYPLDYSFRMIKRKNIAAGEVVNVSVSREFACKYGDTEFTDYRGVTVNIEVCSPAWAGIRTLVVSGKLEPGGRFEVSKVALRDGTYKEKESSDDPAALLNAQVKAKREERLLHKQKLREQELQARSPLSNKLRDHPVIFWLSILGSLASVVGLFLWFLPEDSHEKSSLTGSPIQSVQPSPEPIYPEKLVDWYNQFDDELAAQERAKIEHYGRYVRWTGIVKDKFPAPDDAKLTLSGAQIWAKFNSFEEVATVRKGYKVLVTGKIRYINGNFVTIDDCRLEKVEAITQVSQEREAPSELKENTP